MPRARYLLARRLGPVGLVLTAWDLWRRIPKQHRRRIAREARKHAPAVARTVTTQVRRARQGQTRRPKS
ncbi:MAG: hypothetical protein H0V79_09370 [Actinobacteria bacterium]|nr:hypothetical protein [Actinomycetota bacterium]